MLVRTTLWSRQVSSCVIATPRLWSRKMSSCDAGMILTVETLPALPAVLSAFPRSISVPLVNHGGKYIRLVDAPSLAHLVSVGALHEVCLSVFLTPFTGLLPWKLPALLYSSSALMARNRIPTH